MIKNIKVVKVDITELNVDVIVNPANSSLLGGSGVDGLIHRKSGKKVLEECRKIRNRQGKCKTGNAVITSAGNLPSKYIIHTVGPVWCGGQKSEEILLAKCYEESMKITNTLEIQSIAFPSISTGIYKFPKKLACKIAVETVKHYLESNDSPLTVFFVCFDDESHSIYLQQMKSIHF